MANITINGLYSNYDGMIMLSDIPNIISYETEEYGTKAKCEIRLADTPDYGAFPTGQTLSINGETIVSVNDISLVGGRNFYIGNVKKWIISTMIDALKNCPNIAANYNITRKKDSDGSYLDVVLIEAKINGSKFNIDYKSSILDRNLPHIETEGTSSDDYKNDTFAKIKLDIYKCDNARYNNITNSEAVANEDYVTTMEKTYYENGVRFDISPVIAQFAEYGELTYFRLVMTVFSSSQAHPLVELAKVFNLYVLNGFRNESMPYILKSNVPMMLDGEHKHYVYEPRIDLSWLSSSNSDTFVINYKNSLGTVLKTQSPSLMNISMDKSFNLDETLLRSTCHYVDITLPNGIVKRYEVIKPTKMADKCQRVYWRNCLAGISFFDFTGKSTKKTDMESITYMKSNLGYYDDKVNEIIYSKDVTDTYAITSHIIHEDTLPLFGDMVRSKKAWISDDGIDRDIIITDIDYEELADSNNLFRVTITYHFSRLN